MKRIEVDRLFLLVLVYGSDRKGRLLVCEIVTMTVTIPLQGWEKWENSSFIHSNNATPPVFQPVVSYAQIVRTEPEDPVRVVTAK